MSDENILNLSFVDNQDDQQGENSLLHLSFSDEETEDQGGDLAGLSFSGDNDQKSSEEPLKGLFLPRQTPPPTNGVPGAFGKQKHWTPPQGEGPRRTHRSNEPETTIGDAIKLEITEEMRKGLEANGRKLKHRRTSRFGGLVRALQIKASKLKVLLRRPATSAELAEMRELFQIFKTQLTEAANLDPKSRGKKWLRRQKVGFSDELTKVLRRHLSDKRPAWAYITGEDYILVSDLETGCYEQRSSSYFIRRPHGGRAHQQFADDIEIATMLQEAIWSNATWEDDEAEE